MGSILRLSGHPCILFFVGFLVVFCVFCCCFFFKKFKIHARNRKIVFFFLSQNIFCRYSKEPSQ